MTIETYLSKAKQLSMKKYYSTLDMKTFRDLCVILRKKISFACPIISSLGTLERERERERTANKEEKDV